MAEQAASIFTRPAPVLNVGDLAAERAFYERLGLPVTYEGDEYPTFIAFGTGTLDFGIQATPADIDRPSVLTWQLGVTDADAAAERCRAAGLEFEQNRTIPLPQSTTCRARRQTS
jgi:hypothetical protein